MLNNFLTLVGLLAAIHLICTATFLSPRAPLSVVSEVSVGFACSIGMIVTSYMNDELRLNMFAGGLVLCLVLFSLEKALRGKSVYARKRAPSFN